MKLISLIVTLNFIASAYSQAPEIEWTHSYGGSGTDKALSVIQLEDGSYMLLGYSNSDDGDVLANYGDDDLWLLKIDSIGNVIWSKNYGGSEEDNADKIISTSDNGFLIAGSTSSYDYDITFMHGDEDIWIIKIDSLGNIEWQKCYGGSGSENMSNIVQSSDGNFLVLGKTTSMDGDIIEYFGEADLWLFKINITGEIIWQRSLGTFADDVPCDLVETANGNIVLTSYVWDSWDYTITVLDSVGNFITLKEYGGSDVEEPHAVAKSSTGGVIINGESYSDDGDVSGHHGYYGDYWFVELDSLGNLINQFCFGGSGGEKGLSILNADNMSYILSGYSSTNDNGDVTGHHGIGPYADFWIISLDVFGNIQWQKSIGGTSNDYAYTIEQCTDDGFIVGGYAVSSDGDVTDHIAEEDYWIVKLSAPCSYELYFADEDLDGFGNLYNDSSSCILPLGYISDNSDCNDSDSLIFPGSPEICNNIDDNCNLFIDEGLPENTFFQDADGDLYGNILIDTISCSDLIPGFVSDNTDCDDTNPLIYPGAPELYNGVDDNCNDTIDENFVEIFTLNNEPYLNISPNPNTGTFYISALSAPLPPLRENNQPCVLEIFNSFGQQIYSQELVSSNGNISETISIQNLCSGVYFLTINSGNIIFSQNLIIQ